AGRGGRQAATPAADRRRRFERRRRTRRGEVEDRARAGGPDAPSGGDGATAQEQYRRGQRRSDRRGAPACRAERRGGAAEGRPLGGSGGESRVDQRQRQSRDGDARDG